MRAGQTIVVPSGNYRARLGPLQAFAKLSIMGDPKDPPVIQGNGLPNDHVIGFAPSASNSELANVVVADCVGTGIRADATKVSLTNVTASGCKDTALITGNYSSVSVSNVELRE